MRQHRGTAARHQNEGLDRDLPLREIRFLSRQSGDTVGRVAKGDKHAAVVQGHRIIKLALPTLVGDAPRSFGSFRFGIIDSFRDLQERHRN